MELHDLFLGVEKYKELHNAIEEGYQADNEEVAWMNYWEDDYGLEETPYNINQEGDDCDEE